MPLQLTAEQAFFRDTTLKFLGEQVPAGEIRRLRDDAAGFGRDYWRRGAELGWTSLLVKEEHGGGTVSGNGLADLTLVAGAFGQRAAPGPLLPANVVAATLSTSGGAHAPVVAELVAGTATAAWCVDEPRPSDRLGTVALDARADGGDVVLNGVKRPVESAALASYLLVTGRTGNGLTQVLVPADTPGVSVTPMRTVDLTRRFCVVRFDGVRVPADRVVGEIGGADPEVEHQFQLAAMISNAEAAGAMEAAFGVTLAWACDRYSFGRPLASYQALKHRFADMKAWLEASHAISDAAAAAVHAGSPDAGELVSSAKAFIGDYGSELLQDCVQIHGGIGVTFEHDLHLFLRRHTVNRALYGTPAEHRQRLASPARAHRRGAAPAGLRSRGQQESAPKANGGQQMEDLGGFRQRARAFIRTSLRPASPVAPTLRNDRTDEEELASVARDREVQRMLSDAGLAGICLPREYGGQGLTPAHQQVLSEELAGYECPLRLQIPTFSPCAAVLLDFGTEEQKQRHIPAMLRGEEIWMQFLSEPSGGSDIASALTSAVRDGDEWVLNGSKIWTTGAWWSDWALCLARTNPDVPKHRGLTVFMLPIKQAGVDVHRIEMLNGNREFCQEFLTDVRVPDTDRIGDVDGGWAVCTRWMFYERMLYNSPLVTVPAGTIRGSAGATSMHAIARDTGRLADPVARDLIGEARTLEVVTRALQRRLSEGIATSAMPDQSAAIGRLFAGVAAARAASIAFELAGPAGAAWDDDDGAAAECGTDFLMRQATCIGGGTTEMARNVISERVLGMPREPARDTGIPFRDVPRARPAADAAP